MAISQAIIKELVSRTRKAQGLPMRVTDPRALSRIASLLRRATRGKS